MDGKISSSKKRVIVFGKASGLYRRTIERLVKENLFVVVEKGVYKNIFQKTKESKKLRQLSANKIKSLFCSYVISIFNDSTQTDSKEERLVRRKINSAVEVAKRNSAKSLFVLPYYKTPLSERIEKHIVDKTKQAGLKNSMVVYTPQTIDGVLADEFTNDLFETVIEEGKLTVPVNTEKIYLSETESVVDELIKVLFSFSDFRDKGVIIPSGRNIDDITDLLKEIVPDIQLVADEKVKLSAATTNNITRIDDLSDREIKLFVRDLVKRKMRGVKENKTEKGGLNSSRITKGKGAKTPWIVRRKVKLLTALLFVVLSLPYLVLSASLPLLLSGKYFIERGRLSKAKTVIEVSYSTAAFSEGMLAEYSSLPLVGFVYDNTAPDVSMFTNLLKVTSSAVRAAIIGHGLAMNLYSSKNISVSDSSKEVTLLMDDMYKRLGFVQGQYDESLILSRILEKEGMNKATISYIRGKLLTGKEFVTSLPLLLGESGSRKYLVIFQNNYELRPTGGFIGSFALADFEDANLRDFEVFDVYSADGQLKGYVEPPEPINNYLNSNSWYMRDANWNPDFTESAKTIEWFLEKEMDVKVDGVVALDLEVVKDIIDVFGELYIKDLDRTIKSGDFYAITQHELDREFFPGSRKKKNLLSYLYRELMDRIKSTDSGKLASIGRLVYMNLEERHIQLFVNEEKAQKSVDALGWGGGFYVPDCTGNCYSDWLAIVEANFGVNKANKFIDKDAKLKVVVDKNTIDRSLTVSLANNKGERPYKTYLRVLVPKDSRVGPFEVVSSEGSDLLEPEIYINDNWIEAGVLVGLRPNETLTVNTNWQTQSSLDFSSEGDYYYYWRKQAGIVSDDIKLVIEFPDVQGTIGRDGFLTEGNSISYNTALLRDFVSHIYW
jgi:hypothetical protein